MSDNEKRYTAKEVGNLLRKSGRTVIAEVMEDLLSPPDPYAEAKDWVSGQIFVDAYGQVWKFFPANYCGEDEPPAWNAFGDANTYAFDEPVRPLRGVTIGTESEVFGRLADILGKYDNGDGDGNASLDVVLAVRRLVDGYAKPENR